MAGSGFTVEQGPSTGLSIGAGLAKGLATVYGQKRLRDQEEASRAADRRQQLGMAVLDHLITSGRVADYNDLIPYVDEAFGTTGAKPKKGEISHHDILQQVLQPALAASSAPAAGGAPTGQALATPATAGDAAIVQSMGADRAVAGSPAVSSSATPATAPSTGATGRPGLRILSDADMLQKQLSNEETVTRARAEQQGKLAREFYNTFKDQDPDFTLYDALAMAGFKTDYNRQYSSGAQGMLRGLDAFIAERRNAAEAGGKPWTDADTLQARADWFAQSRTAGVNREALARSTFGRAFSQLTPEQANEVIKKETALLGSQSYSRTMGTEQAQFNAPIDASTAMTTSLPVGATAASIAGQQVLTQPEIEARRSTEQFITQLNHIDKNLIDKGLPDEKDLGGSLPGAWYAAARRGALGDEKRNDVAALEAAVANLVGAAARNVQMQRGAQTEKDAERAYQSIVQLQDAIIKGDTRQSGRRRIAETLQQVQAALQAMPAQAVPASQGTATPRSTAKAALATTGRISVSYNGKVYNFPTQAKADAFKRQFGIK